MYMLLHNIAENHRINPQTFYVLQNVKTKINAFKYKT